MLSVQICSPTFAGSRRIANDAIRHGVDCAVRTADSGGETLAMLLKRPAEVLVVDAYVALPEGAVFLRRVRRTWPHTAFIVVGAVNSQLTGVAVAAGASGVFGIGPEADELACALVCGLLATWPKRSEPCVPAQRRIDAEPTRRELEVLRAMSEGRSNAEIGGLLSLSEDTVKTHARRLYRKLGARDRAHAVAAGFRTGLIT
ncbi:response regulator transcription factor [Glycomyces albus]